MSGPQSDQESLSHSDDDEDDEDESSESHVFDGKRNEPEAEAKEAIPMQSYE